jgi:hypothetical protein
MGERKQQYRFADFGVGETDPTRKPRFRVDNHATSAERGELVVGEIEEGRESGRIRGDELE